MEESVLSFSVHEGKTPNKKNPPKDTFWDSGAFYFIMSSCSSMDSASMIISFAVRFLEAII